MSAEMEQSPDLEQFLVPAPGIQCEHPEVFKLARSLARGAKNDVEVARRLFEFARDSVRYSVYVPFWELEHYLALNTLARGKGYCVQKSALLCAAPGHYLLSLLRGMVCGRPVAKSHALL
ncbi:MAG: transglutaminase domain-containing protein [Desulfarculus sp.]|nr:transglutaminase domain-containing protein [Desulfarculus sp.]